MGFIRICKSKLILLFVVFILLSVSVGPAHADRRYVSDMLIITLREGQGSEYEAIRTLKTGTPIEVLEESGRYLRVRTEEGEEGWVAKQYISSELPKALIIAGLKQETNRLGTRIEELEKRQTLLLGQLKDAERSHDAKVKGLEKSATNYREKVSHMTMELKQITEKYNILLNQSKKVVELISEHDRLQAENAKLDTEMEDLKQENARLRSTRMLRWFLAGAGVFFIGLIAGKASRRKKYY
ncbi:MAG: TIGR04211 family SH3 domain-containing protein [Desulfobacterales bacterium]|nr:TIGR04211 family SH3 domain-containing protein [Desulfobacterales bacterium]